MRRFQPEPGSDAWLIDWWEDDDSTWREAPSSFRYDGASGSCSNMPVRTARDQRRSHDDYRRDGATLMVEKGTTPLDYLQAVMEGAEQPTGHQMQAAVAILPYRHRKQPVAVENSGPDGKPMKLDVAVRFVKPDAP